MSTLQFLAAPFAACLVLAGLHAYLGLHVLRRQVIFVDLALAQIAALGTVVAFALGLHPGEPGTAFFSLTFALLGAALFAITRARQEVIPQEAIIGMTFVVASAAVILVADRAPEGAEHIKETLAGTILWVRWPDVARLAAVYAGVGVFHYVFRRQFIMISENPAEAFRRGMRVRLWDFAFYASFGVVITLSVSVAGILMVFSYLVMPAAIALLVLAGGWGSRLAVASLAALAGSSLGFLLSYHLDMPSGPAVVCSLATLLVFAALWRYVLRPGRGARPAVRLAIILAVAAVAVVAYIVIDVPSPTAEHIDEHDEHPGLAAPADRAGEGDASEPQRADTDCAPLVVLQPGESIETLAHVCYGRDVAVALRRYNEKAGQLDSGRVPGPGDMLELPPLETLEAMAQSDP